MRNISDSVRKRCNFLAIYVNNFLKKKKPSNTIREIITLVLYACHTNVQVYTCWCGYDVCMTLLYTYDVTLTLANSLLKTYVIVHPRLLCSQPFKTPNNTLCVRGSGILNRWSTLSLPTKNRMKEPGRSVLEGL